MSDVSHPRETGSQIKLPSIREILGEFLPPLPVPASNCTHRQPPVCLATPARLSMSPTTSVSPNHQDQKLERLVAQGVLKCDQRLLYLDEGVITVNEQGEKAYPCPRCTLVFRRQVHRIRHLRSHTGVKPFQCRIGNCGKSFSRLDNFRHHMKCHSSHAK